MGTNERGSKVKHLGDITKINGADVALVNVVIGGSPCQDLSVAGKRAGLAGKRSWLFMREYGTETLTLPILAPAVWMRRPCCGVLAAKLIKLFWISLRE